MRGVWAPIYEALFEGDKAGLSHAARGVFAGLCIKAVKLRLGGVVPLPRGEADPVVGVRDIVGGSLDEVRTAFAELVEEPEPLIRVSGERGRLRVTILSWDGWALCDAQEDRDELHSAFVDAGAPVVGPHGAKLCRRCGVVPPVRGRGVCRSCRSDRAKDVAASTGQAAAHGWPGGGPAAAHDRPGGGPEVAHGVAQWAGRTGPEVAHDRPKMGGKGGVSGVQTQEIREEKRREEERERPARAPGWSGPEGGPAAAHDRPTGGPEVAQGVAHANATAEDLLAWVAQQPCLAALVADPRWAKVWALDTTGALGMAGARREDVREAVAAFVTQRGSGARDMARDQLADSLGAFLKNAKRCGDAARARAERAAPRRADAAPAADQGAAEAFLKSFDEAWSRVKRRPRARTSGDLPAALELVGLAHAGAARAGQGVTTEQVLAYWTREHLACQDPHIKDAEHALRLLPKRVDSYGLPRPKRAPPRDETEQPQATPAAPELSPAEKARLAAGMRAALNPEKRTVADAAAS